MDEHVDSRTRLFSPHWRSKCHPVLWCDLILKSARLAKIKIRTSTHAVRRFLLEAVDKEGGATSSAAVLTQLKDAWCVGEGEVYVGLCRAGGEDSSR